ncbi:MAG TPA: hypothetical protein VFU13_20145 [Steroidobacteraceae bacterium]|nr:hypothetical protein [Steroidobacteraceae bacterium]
MRRRTLVARSFAPSSASPIAVVLVASATGTFYDRLGISQQGASGISAPVTNASIKPLGTASSTIYHDPENQWLAFIHL